MTTMAVQKPTTALAVTPTYTQCTAADKFAALPNSQYMIHYKNAATPTGKLSAVDQVTQTPSGAPVVANAFDAVISSGGMGATTELIGYIDNSTRFLDSTGFINLIHVTPTTLSVCIMGPL